MRPESALGEGSEDEGGAGAEGGALSAKARKKAAFDREHDKAGGGRRRRGAGGGGGADDEEEGEGGGSSKLNRQLGVDEEASECVPLRRRPHRRCCRCCDCRHCCCWRQARRSHRVPGRSAHLPKSA